MRDAKLVNAFDFYTVVNLRRGNGDFSTLDSPFLQHHPATPTLRNYKHFGIPVHLSTPPWSASRIHQALARGPHKSAHEHREFLRNEMADMVAAGQWMVLPFKVAETLPGLRLSPIGVVPQHDRRPRTIVDYSYYGLNDATKPDVCMESMQFGKALDRIIRTIVHADPSHGLVHLIKVDLADGFYRMDVAPHDIPQLGVTFPANPAEEPLVAFPLTLPMGWTNSPPAFCTATETIADVANLHILRNRQFPEHPLEAMATTSPSTGDNAPMPDSSCNTVTVPIPSKRDPALMRSRPRPVGAVDVYVDDLIAVAQGSPTRLNAVRRSLLYAIDDVFRPLSATDNTHRKEPDSIKKLLTGDAAWATTKTILGWLIDTQTMTLELPPRRQLRLGMILQQLPRTKRSIPIKDWHRILGELRSMSLALPGARGLFSLLQEAFRHRTQGRLPLSPALHDVLDDMREFYTMLRARPTRLYELVPLTPTLWGTHDAAGHGAGGVWFPSMYATPQAIKLHSAASHSPCCALHEQQPPCCALHEQQPSCCALHEQQPPRCALLGQQPPRCALLGQQQLRCAPFRQQPSDCAPLGQQFPSCAPLGQQPFCSPIVWRVTWPKTISAALVSRDNPTGTITNSDLELAGAFLHHACAAACFDIRERTVKSSTDNTPTLYWERKGSTTTTGPAAYLLRLQALHQRFHRYIKQHDYIPGPDNKMADDASRLHHLSRQQFLTHFQSTYPQNRSWRIWTPPKELVLSVISALRKQRSPVEWFLAETRPPKHTGKSGQNSVSHMQSTLSYPASTIPLSCSKSLLTDTVPGCMLPVENPSRLAQWKVPYARLAKRLPVWGPLTHGWHPTGAHNFGSNGN